MRVFSWRGTISLIAALLLPACSAGSMTEYQVVPSTPVSSPTHVTVVYVSPTPQPSPTEVAPAMEEPASTPSPVLYDDRSAFFGGLIVTLDHVGKTITLKRGQDFLLRLGSEYNWDVTVAPEKVVSRNMVFTPEPGEVGLYVARGTGEATLSAVGEPQCRFLQPACTRPSVLFTLQILVE